MKIIANVAYNHRVTLLKAQFNVHINADLLIMFQFEQEHPGFSDQFAFHT
jgi:hypothetical protein